ncbi:heme/hemin ABC transporter substrate-binding protein [Marinomonas sargassi]|nr:ABC transporter substrate-binding protein [Marinomonas sargassi]
MNFFRLSLVFGFIFGSFFCNLQASERIAVAGGSITEIIYRLGEEQRIVGVDSTSTFNNASQKHPLLGYVRNISVEGLLSLKPDLLIGESDTGPTKALEQVQAVGLETLIINEDDSISGIKDKIRQVAKQLNVEEKGEQLIQEMQVDIDALAYAKQQLKSTENKPKVLFLLALSNGAPIASGHSTSANTAIIEAGGINVLATEKGWKKLSPESALALNPDVIIVMNRHANILNDVAELPHFKYTAAVKNAAVYGIDGGYLLGFGPRTPQAIVELGTMIHEQFPLPANYHFRYKRNTQGNLGH